MALTSEQLVLVAEITYETYASVEELAADLNAAQESSISDDLYTWETVRDSHVLLKGGGDGVDFDNERKREAIRRRIRKALGLPLISSETGAPTGSVFAGGISQGDKDARASNSDRTESFFTVGLHQ